MTINNFEKIDDIISISLSKNLIGKVFSNKQYIYDKYICKIEHKGFYTNKICSWWYNEIISKNIVKTNYLYDIHNVMFTYPCHSIPILIEIIGYQVNNNNITLLDKPIINIILKTESNKKIISNKDVLEMNIISNLELEIMIESAIKIFKFGNDTLKEKNIIMVASKYEFGLDKDKSIILIGNLHSIESSKYINKSNPDNLCLYNNPLPKYCINKNIYNIENIPLDMILKTTNVYRKFYKILEPLDSDEYIYIDKDLFDRKYWDSFKQRISEVASSFLPTCIIISDYNNEEIDQIINLLDKNIHYNLYVINHSKEIRKLLKTLKRLQNNKNIIFLTISYMGNSLGEIVANNSISPVINFPYFNGSIEMCFNSQFIFKGDSHDS